MKQILTFEEADKYLSPYYERIVRILDKCFEDCVLLYDTFSKDAPATFKNRTKGSFIADRLKERMQLEFNGDSNIQFANVGSVFGIVVSEKIFIRFNKMDRSFGVSINKNTRATKRFLNQNVLGGLPEDVTLVWGGFNPDKPWTKALGHYLTCYNGSLNWHYDMGRGGATQQLTINIPPAKPAPSRVRAKKNKDKETGIDKTGTGNK